MIQLVFITTRCMQITTNSSLVMWVVDWIVDGRIVIECGGRKSNTGRLGIDCGIHGGSSRRIVGIDDILLTLCILWYCLWFRFNLDVDVIQCSFYL